MPAWVGSRWEREGSALATARTDTFCAGTKGESHRKPALFSAVSSVRRKVHVRFSCSVLLSADHHHRERSAPTTMERCLYFGVVTG